MRIEKNHLVNYIGTLFTESDYVYFISYDGLSVKEITDLRIQLSEVGGKCQVLKNSLILKAAEMLENKELAALSLVGGTALVYGNGDASAAAKVITEYGKKINKVAPKGGYFEGAVLSVSEVEDIAALPPKPVLQAMLLGVLQAPARDFVSVLNAKAATILNVLNAYKDKIDNN